MSVSEKQLQQTCVEMLRTLYPECITVSSLNGITLSGKNKYAVIAEEKKSGLLKGWPDLEVVLPNEVIYLELKTDKGVQSKEQKEIQSRLTKLNKKYYLVRNYTEALQALSDSLPVSYRSEAYNALVANLNDPLDTNFLFFPTGTKLEEVTEVLKAMYKLKDIT